MVIAQSCHTGAFVAASIGGLLWGFGACALRIGWLWIQAKRKGVRFDAFDRPTAPYPPSGSESERISADEARERVERQEREDSFHVETQKGRFY